MEQDSTRQNSAWRSSTEQGSLRSRLRERVRVPEQPGLSDLGGRWRALPYTGAMVTLCAVAFFGLHWLEPGRLEPVPRGGLEGALENGVGGSNDQVVVERVERGPVLFVEGDEAAGGSDLPIGADTGDALGVDDLLDPVGLLAVSDDLAGAGDDGGEGEPAEGESTDGGTGEVDGSAGSSTTTAQTSTTRSTTTTTRPSTTTTTRRSTTTQQSGSAEPQYFSTRGVGASLPSGEWCAARIKPRPEVRSMNSTLNSTRGSNPNNEYPRVDGDFTGTTDEIIQWAACKWGIDENVVRAQALVESWWDARRQRDETTDQEDCYPSLRTSSGTCPASVGLLQIKYGHHQSAYEDGNALRSTAYNLDYAYAIWRECYEGDVEWLNDVDRGKEYRAGDLEGCLGFWYSGRWHTSGAIQYFETVMRYKNSRGWEDSDFLKYRG